MSLDKALSKTSTDGLLQTFASLTHQIHSAEDTLSAQAIVAKREHAVLLRRQRDAVKHEILRRTGDIK